MTEEAISVPDLGELVGILAAGAVTVALNGIVLVAITCILRKGTTQSKFLLILLGYLAVSDLLLGAVTAVIKLNCFIQGCGFLSCATTVGFIFWIVSCSMFGIVLVAVDRFVFILYGIYYFRWFTTRRVYIAIILSVIVGFTGFGPALIPLYKINDPYQFCSLPLISPIELQIFILIAIWFCILLVIIINSVIFGSVIRTVNNIRGTSQRIENGAASPSQVWTPSKKKAIKFLFYTTGAFLVSYIPPVTWFTIQLFYSTDLQYELATSAVLVNLNSILNPIIYAFWQKDIRDLLKKSCRLKICPKAEADQ